MFNFCLRGSYFCPTLSLSITARMRLANAPPKSTGSWMSDWSYLAECTVWIRGYCHEACRYALKKYGCIFGLQVF
jgi:hypothetical protein